MKRRFPGLSLSDSTLLKIWITREDLGFDELHTHVPVGSIPVAEGLEHDEFTQIQLNNAWPRRIDAAMRFGDRWWIIECKPAADHHALGQVLCYAYWWETTAHMTEAQRVIVLTDRMDEDCRGAYRYHGVDFVELGGVLAASDRRRRYMVDVE